MLTLLDDAEPRKPIMPPHILVALGAMKNIEHRNYQNAAVTAAASIIVNTFVPREQRSEL
jgi:hypothetical protein